MSTVVDLTLSLGADHPSTHGVLRLGLTLAGDEIVSADPQIGFLHRGAEKLFEVRDLQQVLVLADRHDWLSAAASEIPVCLAAEQLCGLVPPERAIWLRTLFAELTRLAHHVLFLGFHPGTSAPARQAAERARQELLALLERATGSRIHPMVNQVGGLRADVPDTWIDQVPLTLDLVARELDTVLPELEALHPQLSGVAVLSREMALGYGCSGHVGRASGVDVDLRRDEPYLAYGQLGHLFSMPSSSPPGDAATRIRLLGEQARTAVELARACVLPVRSSSGAPVNVRLPKVLRLPEGQTYAWAESPSGISGVWLVSTGEPVPWRLKLRTAGFAHASAIGALLPGCTVDQIPAVLAGLCLVQGDVDK